MSLSTVWNNGLSNELLVFKKTKAIFKTSFKLLATGVNDDLVIYFRYIVSSHQVKANDTRGACNLTLGLQRQLWKFKNNNNTPTFSYIYVNKTLSWNDASKYCKMTNGYLPIISSLYEFEIFVDYMITHKLNSTYMGLKIAKVCKQIFFILYLHVN